MYALARRYARRAPAGRAIRGGAGGVQAGRSARGKLQCQIARIWLLARSRSMRPVLCGDGTLRVRFTGQRMARFGSARRLQAVLDP